MPAGTYTRRQIGSLAATRRHWSSSGAPIASGPRSTLCSTLILIALQDATVTYGLQPQRSSAISSALFRPAQGFAAPVERSTDWTCRLGTRERMPSRDSCRATRNADSSISTEQRLRAGGINHIALSTPPYFGISALPYSSPPAQSVHQHTASLYSSTQIPPRPRTD